MHIFSENFKVSSRAYGDVLVDMDSLMWALSVAARGRLLQRKAEQGAKGTPRTAGQWSPQSEHSTEQQSKAGEATSPIDTSSDRGKVTSEKASRSVQERQMDI